MREPSRARRTGCIQGCTPSGDSPRSTDARWSTRGRSAPLALASSTLSCTHTPSDVPTCKTNLFKWLSAAVDELNKDGAGIVHCWTKTKLLRAWEGPVQAEAARRAEELFPNLSDGDFLPADFKEDEEAGFMGLPFTQQEGEIGRAHV